MAENHCDSLIHHDAGKTGTLSKKGARHERQTWSSQLDFIMTGIGTAVGLGNIWRFPFLCYKNGGGAFLIPYLISFFLMSAPIFILETGLGQYTGENCVGAWNMLPAFKGVGVCGAVVLAYIDIYYIIVIAWALYYLFMSLRAQVPWATCGNEWNTERCFVSGMSSNRTRNCSAYADVAVGNMSVLNCSLTPVLPPKDAVEEFWERGVLRQSSGIDEPGGLVPGLSVSLLVAWILVYLCLCKGIKWTGKLVYVTATLPYLFLTILLVRTAMLDGAGDGIIYYLRPDFSRLADGQVWVDAASQVLFSSGVGLGCLITLGSYNKFHANPVRNGLIITSINAVTSLFGGFCVFSVLGFMAHETGKPIQDVVSSGPGLVFLTYPKVMTQLPLTSLWSTLFFAMVLFLGLDTQFAGIEGLITVWLDMFPKTLYKPRNRMLFLAAYSVVCYLLGLTMMTEGGIYVFQLVDHYGACGLVLLITVFFEAVVIGWVFGADKFADALELMIGHRVGWWMKLSWKFFTPVATLAIVLFQVSTFKSLGHSFPPWSTVLGVAMLLSSTLCAPIGLVYSLIVARGSFKQRLKAIATPRLRRHQIHPRWAGETGKWRYRDESDTYHTPLENNVTEKCSL